MNEGPELKPCPFCGKNAKLISRKNWGHRIECQWCCVHSPAYRTSTAMALYEWNTRIDLCLTQADLDAAVKDQKAEIERLKSCISDMQKRAASTRGDQAYRELPSYIVKACAAAIRKGEPT